MGVSFLRVVLNKKSALADVPKGHFVVYVGEAEKRFVIPLSYLKHPSFQKLLHKAEEEFGFSHGMSGIRVPSSEQAFKSLIHRLNELY
ncbi:Small auxin-up RNA protein [Dioscorea alata]|uniref:Small auxin-up RNA protein n=1 Tax=Dioscorea alata TaxID=55571 RepID=A0ACB7V6I9_DIOAL|nr:Small auxin-up RNA protein [Dioscorea alata]